MNLTANQKKYGVAAAAIAAGAGLGYEFFWKKKSSPKPAAKPEAQPANPLPVHVQGPASPPAAVDDPSAPLPGQVDPGITFDTSGTEPSGWVNAPTGTGPAPAQNTPGGDFSGPGWHEGPDTGDPQGAMDAAIGAAEGVAAGVLPGLGWL